MIDKINVGYSAFKLAVQNSGAKVYWKPDAYGCYTLYATTETTFLICPVSVSSDTSDFESTLKVLDQQVTSQNDAQILSAINGGVLMNNRLSAKLDQLMDEVRATSNRLRSDQTYIERWCATVVSGNADIQMLNSAVVPSGYTPQNIEYTVPAPVSKSTTNTSISLVSQNAALDTNQQEVVGGDYSIVMSAGTNPGTVKLSYNNGASVDNVSANTNNITLNGGVAGRIIVNIGSIPQTLPQTETISVVAKVFYLKGMRVALDSPSNAINVSVNLQIGIDKKIRVALNTNSPTDASNYDPAIPVLAGNIVIAWVHSSSQTNSTITFVRFTGIEEFY